MNQPRFVHTIRILISKQRWSWFDAIIGLWSTLIIASGDLVKAGLVHSIIRSVTMPMERRWQRGTSCDTMNYQRNMDQVQRPHRKLCWSNALIIWSFVKVVAIRSMSLYKCLQLQLIDKNMFSQSTLCFQCEANLFRGDVPCIGLIWVFQLTNKLLKLLLSHWNLDKYMSVSKHWKRWTVWLTSHEQSMSVS